MFAHQSEARSPGLGIIAFGNTTAARGTRFAISGAVKPPSNWASSTTPWRSPTARTTSSEYSGSPAASSSITAYELTDRGIALEPVLIELGRWGSREHNTARNELSVSAMMFSYKTVFDPSRATSGRYGVRIDGEAFTVTVRDAELRSRRGIDPAADVVLETDMATVPSAGFEPAANRLEGGCSIH